MLWQSSAWGTVYSGRAGHEAQFAQAEQGLSGYDQHTLQRVVNGDDHLAQRATGGGGVGFIMGGGVFHSDGEVNPCILLLGLLRSPEVSLQPSMKQASIAGFFQPRASVSSSSSSPSSWGADFQRTVCQLVVEPHSRAVLVLCAQGGWFYDLEFLGPWRGSRVVRGEF